jgi:hypothetical protein
MCWPSNPAYLSLLILSSLSFTVLLYGAFVCPPYTGSLLPRQASVQVNCSRVAAWPLLLCYAGRQLLLPLLMSHVHTTCSPYFATQFRESVSCNAKINPIRIHILQAVPLLCPALHPHPQVLVTPGAGSVASCVGSDGTQRLAQLMFDATTTCPDLMGVVAVTQNTWDQGTGWHDGAHAQAHASQVSVRLSDI